LNSGGATGTYGGSTSTYAKVSLCEGCNRKRDEAAARAFWWSVAFVVLAFCALAVAFVVSRHRPAFDDPKKGEAPDPAMREEGEARDRKQREAAEAEAKRQQEEREAREKAAREEIERQAKEAAEKRAKDAAAKKAAEDEEAAVERLKYAKKLLDQDMGELAKDRLQRIVKEWPDTKAAAAAKELLKKLQK
jgi:hypothetical protein